LDKEFEEFYVDSKKARLFGSDDTNKDKNVPESPNDNPNLDDDNNAPESDNDNPNLDDDNNAPESGNDNPTSPYTDDDEDMERVDLHRHQLSKYGGEEIRRIAEKGSRKEELTSAEKEL